YDLSHEPGFLSASEQFVLRETAAHVADRRRAGPMLLGDGHAIHPTARIIGPVILHAGASIGENASVVGPALVGTGARIGEGAVVAQAAVGAQCTIPALKVVRHRAILQDMSAADSCPSAPATDWHSAPAFKPASGPTPVDTDRVAYFRIKRALDTIIA